MKVLRLIERIAHWVALLLGVVAIVAIGVIIGRPSEKSGNRAELCRRRAAAKAPRGFSRRHME